MDLSPSTLPPETERNVGNGYVFSETVSEPAQSIMHVHHRLKLVYCYHKGNKLRSVYELCFLRCLLRSGLVECKFAPKCSPLL